MPCSSCRQCIANTNCKSQWHYGLRSTVGRCLPNTQTICTTIMRTLKLCKHLVAYCKCGNALSRTSLNRPSLDANYDYRNDYRPDASSLPPPDLRSAFRLAFVSSKFCKYGLRQLLWRVFIVQSVSRREGASGLSMM